jgi:N-acetylmuramoyl-L-alanine amidase
MKRRWFLKNIPVVGFVVLEIKQAIGQILQNILSAPIQELPELTIQVTDQSSITIPIFWKNQLAYVSTSQMAKALQYRTYFNDTKKKIVLYLPLNKVVVTANNAFIIIDDETFQMPASTLWLNNEIYTPIKYFLPLIQRHTALSLDYDPNQQLLQMNTSKFNITDITISSRENGTVIRFKTLKEFRAGEITADMRYGWLHVDLYSGKIDSVRIKQTKTAGLVSKIKTFQFAELASVAFLLKKEPLAHEIIPQPENNEILVILRTAEEIPEDQLSQEDSSYEEAEPSDEVKKQLEEERRKWLIDMVIIDPGHGGRDPGTVAKDKTKEKDIVLAIALKLGKLISKELPEVKVIYTRNSDTFIPLQQRTKIANENNGKIFISIHANSNDNKRASGFETYILGPEKGDMARDVVLKENSVINFEDSQTRNEYKGVNQILATMAQNAFSRQSEYLASLVQQEVDKKMQGIDFKGRGVKQGPFWVMVGASMPNILIETGFLSNAYDLKILKTAAYQFKMAEGIFEGLKRYKRDYESAI